MDFTTKLTLGAAVVLIVTYVAIHFGSCAMSDRCEIRCEPRRICYTQEAK